MTGVGYAAPVLFEVFGLLPKGEWFAEPLGDPRNPPWSAARAAIWRPISAPTAIR